MATSLNGITKRPVPQNEALSFTQALGLGWNLGNTFDACGRDDRGLAYETAWSRAITTKEMIEAVHAAGFQSVRLPVSWHNHVSGEDDRIDEAWLNRVQTVVDWCIDCGMNVILNIHHDNFPTLIYPDEAHMERSVQYLQHIWGQLCQRFAAYNERLIFNSMNEPRLVGHANEWRYDEQVPECVEAAKCINQLNQVFVDTVRASGGKNARRYLLCPGYAAAPEGALTQYYQLPKDPVSENEGHILVSVHAYSPYPFALAGDDMAVQHWQRENEADLRGMTWFMDGLYDKYVAKGVGVLLDEFGARNRNNTADRCAFAESYVTEARSRGIPCFWWDNNLDWGNGERFRLIDRAACTWSYPEIVDSMQRAMARF